MSAGNIVFLCIAFGGITLFGATLAWASWMEGRAQKRKKSKMQDDLGSMERGAAPARHPAPKILSRPF